MTARRPHSRIRRAAVFWCRVLTGPVDAVLAALITHAVTSSRGAGLVVFIPTFVVLGAITIWARERWLPKERQR